MKFVVFFYGSILAIQMAVAQQPPAPPVTPRIASSIPTAWAVDVPPRSKTISVTFDQPMIAGFTAWLGRNSIPPEIDLGDSTVSDDRKTFVLNVAMEPAKVYVLALNEKGIPGAGFQNDKGESLPRHYLVFQTAGTPPPNEAPPRVVSTTPTNGSQQLDPTRLKSLAITFDRPMQVTRHGLHMIENKKEIDLSTAKFEYSSDRKGFTLGYEFKPSSTYEFELNSTQNIGFASAQRIPLWPVKFAFSTGHPQ